MQVWRSKAPYCITICTNCNSKSPYCIAICTNCNPGHHARDRLEALNEVDAG